jgi:hypothetical protein
VNSFFGAASTSGYNDASYSHTPATGDNFAIVVTWQMQVDAANGAVGYPPTPGAPTYGGQAMAYVGTAAQYSDPPGDGNSQHRGVWLYVLEGIPAGEQTVVFTPTTGYRSSIGTITGRWINPPAEDTVSQNNQGGGSYSLTLDPTTVGAFTVHVSTGNADLSGDGTEAWSWVHDEDDNRWDSKFNAEYFIATGITKTYDGGTAGMLNGHFCVSFKGGEYLSVSSGITPTGSLALSAFTSRVPMRTLLRDSQFATKPRDATLSAVKRDTSLVG